jgi:hypothetical protein
MQDIQHPSPEEMTAHLAKAAEEGYWNHWEHDFKKHRFDWVKSRDVKNPLSPDQFSRIPMALARHQHVELCIYTYKGRTVWAYHRKHLLLDRIRLTETFVVYDPVEREIIHCMRVGRSYCERHADFVKIRWK